MGQTQVYLDVEAQAAFNNAMGINYIDDGTSGGGTGVSTWINWTASGYTGIGWFWDDPNNDLKTGWENLVNSGHTFACGVQHTTDFESFKQHVAYDRADNLDNILGQWSNESKLAFLKSHTDVFADCTT